MNSPVRDGLIPLASMKAFGILLGVLALFWMGADRRERKLVAPAAAVSIVYSAAYRLYRWRRHPFGGAAAEWNLGERDRYVRRQLAQRDRLLLLSPHQFEDAVAQLLRVRYNFKVKRTRYSGDGGWDVEFQNESGRVLVECKQYRPEKAVGRPALQKLHSALVTEQAESGVLITTSFFSQPARQFADQTGIQLVDGAGLSRLMREAYGDGPKADVAYAMCTQCGELVEFEASADVNERPCPSAHRVSNHLAEYFRRADRLAAAVKQKRSLLTEKGTEGGTPV